MIYHKTTIEDWKIENLPEFDELILSWNSARPKNGQYQFYISVKIGVWSPWLLYASWGNDEQRSFKEQAENIRIYQDTLEITDGKKASGFQIKILPNWMGELSPQSPGIEIVQEGGIHVYTNSDQLQESIQEISYSSTLQIGVTGLSQMQLDHPRHKSLCSPTATTAIVRHFLKNFAIDPIDFANKSWDQGFNIYGNWVFSVAEAASRLGSAWSCWVERLAGFDPIYQQLQRGMPTIVSIRGPLPGSALPHEEGHIIAVIGYDAEKQKVLCMDPAFNSDANTLVGYKLSDFLHAWNRRGRVAYVFSKRESVST